MFKSRDESVEGLTTAASILFASAIGITIALNELLMALLLTLMVVLILAGLGFVEGWVTGLKQYYNNRDK